jgi:hypothetical protein
MSVGVIGNTQTLLAVGFLKGIAPGAKQRRPNLRHMVSIIGVIGRRGLPAIATTLNEIAPGAD